MSFITPNNAENIDGTSNNLAQHLKKERKPSFFPASDNFWKMKNTFPLDYEAVQLFSVKYITRFFMAYRSERV